MAPIAVQDFHTSEIKGKHEYLSKKNGLVKASIQNFESRKGERVPKAPCRVFDFILHQVQTQPNAPAVQFGKSKPITYLELSGLTTRIVSALSIRRGSIVPICMNASVEFVATILAIIQSGAAYTILDPRGSVGRNNIIVEDCKANIVVVDQAYAPLFDKSIVLESAIAKHSFNGESSSIENDDVKASDIAYLVYTSGKSPRRMMCLVNALTLKSRLDRDT